MTQIGWFGFHNRSGTMTHAVNAEEVPLCKYRPVKSAMFQWCLRLRSLIDLRTIECDTCRDSAHKRLLKGACDG